MRIIEGTKPFAAPGRGAVTHETAPILEHDPAREAVLDVIMQKAEAGDTITIPVPDHRELRIGTLLSIVRQSGLPRSLFERAGAS